MRNFSNKKFYIEDSSFVVISGRASTESGVIQKIHVFDSDGNKIIEISDPEYPINYKRLG
jgi:ribosomal protein S4E